MSADNSNTVNNITWADGEEKRLDAEVCELREKAITELYNSLVSSLGYTSLDGEVVRYAELLFELHGLTNASIDEKIEYMCSVLRSSGDFSVRNERISRDELLDDYIVIVRCKTDDEGNDVKYFDHMVKANEYRFIMEREITLERFDKLCQVEQERIRQLEEARIRRRMMRMEEERRRYEEEIRRYKEERKRYKEERKRLEEDSDDSDVSDDDSDEEKLNIHEGDRFCNCALCRRRYRAKKSQEPKHKKSRK